MDKKIIVIGAGASGVAAATKLLSNGFKNVIILEAENRIGGRVNTVPFGANVVDLGGQWCMGEKGNVVYELAKDKDLLATTPAFQGYYNSVRSDGQQIPIDLSTKIIDFGMDIYKGEKYTEEKTNYHGSLGNFFTEKYNEALKRDEFKDVDRELAHQTLELFDKMFCSDNGANSWYEFSCNDPFKDCEGDELLSWKDKGYITVFDLLQNKISNGVNPLPPIDILPLTQFNKVVKKIVYNQPDGITKVECEDGSSYYGDHVICTMSLGVLKHRHLSMFEPMLPLSKFINIEKLSFGTLGKIFVEFEKPFWGPDWAGFSILWKLEQLKEVREDPVNGDWLERLYGCSTFNSLQPNVLLFWTSGRKAWKVEEKSDEDIKVGIEKILRMFVKQYNIPEIKAMIRTKWHSNPNFRGTYSSYTLESDALRVSGEKIAEELAEPIVNTNGRPVIQFAGEATNADHNGSVHGAIETGWREADRLIQLYK